MAYPLDGSPSSALLAFALELSSSTGTFSLPLSLFFNRVLNMFLDLLIFVSLEVLSAHQISFFSNQNHILLGFMHLLMSMIDLFVLFYNILQN